MSLTYWQYRISFKKPVIKGVDTIICKITITVIKATIYRKAILIIEKQLGKGEKCMAYRNKRVMLRSAIHIAEMTVDKDVSRKNLYAILGNYFRFILMLIIKFCIVLG